MKNERGTSDCISNVSEKDLGFIFVDGKGDKKLLDTGTGNGILEDKGGWTS